MSWLSIASSFANAAGSSLGGGAPGDYIAPSVGPVNIGGLNTPAFPFQATNPAVAAQAGIGASVQREVVIGVTVALITALIVRRMGKK